MLKRVMPFLVVTCIFLVASCGTAASQSSYAAEMQPAIEKLADWQDHAAELDALLTDPIDPANGGGMSRLDMIEFYNMATEYQITRDDYVDMGFSPLDLLVGESNKFAKEGRDIQNILSSVTPDDDIQAAHQAVLQCVQARADFAEEISLAIKDLVGIDMSGDASVCVTFDADLEKLTAYVNEHK